MNETQFAGTEHFITPSYLPVDRFTRRLVRDVVVRIGPDRSWAIIRSRRFCKWLLYWRIKRHPVQLNYELYTGSGGWTKHSVIPAVG